MTSPALETLRDVIHSRLRRAPGFSMVLRHILRLAMAATFVRRVFRRNEAPDFVQLRREQFDPLPAATADGVTFLGDSLTRDAPLVDLLTDYRQRGLGWLRVADAASTLPISGPPMKRLVLLLGTNDVTQDLAPAIFAEQYTNLLESITQSRSALEVVIMSIPPQRGPGALRVRPMNEVLSDLAAHHSIRYIDLFSLLVDENGELDQRWTTDGIHLNAAGYARARPAFQAAAGC